MKAHISEIFESIQGEGPYTGDRQIFVRLAGCPLRCDYCDTPQSLTTKGHRALSVETVVSEILKLSRKSGVKTVSLTGGEPLAHVGFLKELFPRLRERGFHIYLETAGVHHAALRSVVRWVDVVSMDLKPTSATGRNFWNQHERFLAVAGRKAFVKLVLEKHTQDEEIGHALGLLSSRRHKPLLVLQPVTPRGRKIQPPSPERLGDIVQRARARLPRVLVLPQQHILWGIK